MSIRTSLLGVSTVVLLVACGGGGGGGDSSASNGSPTPPPNQAPTADAGADQTVFSEDEVTLSGSASDPDGDTLTVEWTQIAGQSVTLDGASGLSPSFTAPSVDEEADLEFELTVSDGELTDSDTVVVTVKPEVSISGQVIDDPISGARVVAEIGVEMVETVADSAGRFVIQLPSVDPASLITITAYGPTGSEEIELTSFVGTLADVREAAGDDGVLQSEELSYADVTHLTTAEAALMLRIEGVDDITTGDRLDDLRRAVDPSEILDIAAMIKLVVDLDYALPEGFGTTFTFAKDQAAVEDFICMHCLSDKTRDFGDVREAIIDELAIGAPFSVARLEGRKLWLYLPGEHFRYSGARFRFGANARGLMSHPQGEVGFHWEITDGALEISLDEDGRPYLETQNSLPTKDAGLIDVVVHRKVIALRIQRLGHAPASEALVLSTRRVWEFPELSEEELASLHDSVIGFEQEIFSYERGIFEDTISGFEEHELTGLAGIPCCQARGSDEDLPAVEHLISIENGGGGFDLDDGRPVNWSLDGGVLVMQFDAGVRAELRPIRRIEGGNYEVLTIFNKDGTRRAHDGVLVVGSLDSVRLDQTDLLGEWTAYGGAIREQNVGNFVFRYFFDQDGVGVRGFGSPDITWELVSDPTLDLQNLVIRQCRRWDGTEFYSVPVYSDEILFDENHCLYYSKKTWRILRYEDGYLTIHSLNRAKPSPGGEVISQFSRVFYKEPEAAR